MRLIDADKLEATAVLGVQLQHADSRYYYFCEVETIEKAPTVKAIPIEWIKEYASMKSFNDEMDCYWHFWEDDVLKMVAEWEKENE